MSSITTAPLRRGFSLVRRPTQRNNASNNIRAATSHPEIVCQRIHTVPLRALDSSVRTSDTSVSNSAIRCLALARSDSRSRRASSCLAKLRFHARSMVRVSSSSQMSSSDLLCRRRLNCSFLVSSNAIAHQHNPKRPSMPTFAPLRRGFSFGASGRLCHSDLRRQVCGTRHGGPPWRSEDSSRS